MKENKILNIKCFKWIHKKSHKRKYEEMFDYDTENFRLSEYNVNSKGGIIIDNSKYLKFIENSENLDLYDDIFKIDDVNNIDENKNNIEQDLNNNLIIESNFKFSHNQEFIIKYNKHSYIVVKYLNQESSYSNLTLGSFIKIGKYFLKVILLKIENEIKYKNKINYLNLPNINNNENIPSCRFCFREKTENNLLINVCDCKGTLKYLHTQCLQKWLKNKCEFSYEFINPNYFKIKIKNFYCEICKKTFPLFVRIPDLENEFVYLLEILKTKNNYIILKNILVENEDTIETFKKEFNKSKEYVEYLYIEFNNYYNKNNQILIGRDKKCDVILDDISMSRQHCMIYIPKNNLEKVIKIKDLGSKFGTLITMQDDIILDELNPNITLQKGNTVYHFKLKNI